MRILKFNLLAIAAALICMPCAAESVMRFTLLKVMTNGVQTSSGNRSSIYVTISGRQCYDSDNHGFSNDTGVRTLMPNTENSPTYSGPTYWGYGKYRFAKDYSRLNVLVGNNVYVYTRAEMSTGKSTYFGGNSGVGSTPQTPPQTPKHSSGSENGRIAPLSAEQYQYYYNKFAEQAEQIYKDVTIKIKYADGHTERRSGYSSSDSYYAYSGMLRNLRKCQSEMRRIREEAARYGIRITKSYYETVTVRF